jgi:hypothetical protein
MAKPYEEIRSSLKTGDIVLFSGKSAFSLLIKVGTKSKWSHVGMILNLTEYDFVTIWESTPSSDLEDLDTNTHNKGVQLVPLSLRIDTYKGDIAIRRLQGVDLGEEAINKLMKLRHELKGRKYEKDEIELLKATYDKGPLEYNEEDLSSLFCSELVAEAYQCLGLLKDKPSSNEYNAKNFSEKGEINLESGRLGPEILIREYKS